MVGGADFEPIWCVTVDFVEEPVGADWPRRHHIVVGDLRAVRIGGHLARAAHLVDLELLECVRRVVEPARRARAATRKKKEGGQGL